MGNTTENEYLICNFCGKEMVYSADSHGMVSQCPHCSKDVVLVGTSLEEFENFKHLKAKQEALRNRPSIWKREFSDETMNKWVIRIGVVFIIVAGVLVLFFGDFKSDGTKTRMRRMGPIVVTERVTPTAEAIAEEERQALERLDPAVNERVAKRLEKETQERERETLLRNRITIKGLYIGMSMQEARDAIAQKFGTGWRLAADMNTGVWFVYNTYFEKMWPALGQPSDYDYWVKLIFSTDKNTLSVVDIGPNCANALFSAQTLNENEFKKMFMEAYGIPEMKVQSGYWEYINSDSICVRVSFKKGVTFGQTADRAKVKQQFN